MQISGNSDAYQASQAQRALNMLLQQAPADAGQTPPSDGPMGPPAPGARPAASPGEQFAPDTLSGLLSVQQQQPPSSADIASDLMSQADTDGDGKLSADEIAKALGQDASSGDLASALSKLDRDGDGKLSADELTAGLDAARKAHHHHGGHKPEAAADSSAAVPDAAAAGKTATPKAAEDSAAVELG